MASTDDPGPEATTSPAAEAQPTDGLAPSQPSAATGEVNLPARPAPPAPTPVDLGRRRFFRQFAGELVNTAATMAGAAQALQRASAEAAAGILNPESGAASLAAAMAEPVVPLVPSGFRTPFREDPGVVHIIDQRQLPERLVEVDNRSAAEVAYSIREMVIRGGPAIGQIAAIGMALTADRIRTARPFARRATLRGAANALVHARPTGANLRVAVDRMMARYEQIGDLTEDGDAIADALRREADAIILEATSDHGRIAANGLAILPVPAEGPVRILTHGNTGALGSGQFGTALGIVLTGHHAERAVHVWVDETRPYLQGSRLTAWELTQAGVPHTVIPDVAAGHLLARGEVDLVLVGAERIAANGDSANTVGTYALAVLAARHGVPFYVAAPTAAVDLETADGSTIPIEERSADELLLIGGIRVGPSGSEVRNPAFDVTPAELIGGFITEEGVVRAPFAEGLRDAAFASRTRWAAQPGHDRPPRAPG